MTSGKLTCYFYFKAQNLNSLQRLLYIFFYASSRNLVLHQDSFPWLIIFFILINSFFHIYWFHKEKSDLDQV